MRLIDADKYGGKVIASHCCSGVIKLVSIDDVPTAYDVDKVVEKLEEIQDKAVSVKNEDISIYATGMMGKIIEIVKAGGKE